MASARLAERRLAGVEAPIKLLFLFDKSGHLVPFEEPERFNELMLKEVVQHG